MANPDELRRLLAEAGDIYSCGCGEPECRMCRLHIAAVNALPALLDRIAELEAAVIEAQGLLECRNVEDDYILQALSLLECTALRGKENTDA